MAGVFDDVTAARSGVLDRLASGEPVDSAEREAVDQLSTGRQGEFRKGLRRAAYNASATSRGFLGGMAEPFAPDFADDQFARAERISRSQPANIQPEVASFRDVDSVGSAGAYAAGALGEATTSIGGMVAAGLAARFGLGSALRLGATGKNAAQFGGSMAAMLPQEGGETALTLRQNPEAMANTTPAQRAALTLGRGTVNSALESIVPNLLLTNAISGVGGRIAAGMTPALGNIARKSAAGVVGEAGTEGAQELTGQYAENLAVPGTGYDAEPVFEAAVRGAIAGGVLGGAGGTIQAARSNIDAAAETAREEGGPAAQDALNRAVAGLDNLVRNPEQVGADMTNATMGSLAEAAARASEVGAEVADRAGPAAASGIDAIVAMKGRMDGAIMGQLTPENAKKYRELTKNFRLLNPSEYELLRDAMETGNAEQINEAVGQAAKLFGNRVPRETLEGLKNLASWGKKFAKGVTNAARERRASVNLYEDNDIKKFRLFLSENYPTVLRDMDSTEDSDTLARAFMTMRDTALSQLEKGKKYEDDADTRRDPFWLNDRDRAAALYFEENFDFTLPQMLADAVTARNEATTRAEQRDLLQEATVFSSPTENLGSSMERSLTPELREQYEEAGTPIGPGAVGADPDVIFDESGRPMNQEDTRRTPINSLGAAQRLIAADMINGEVIRSKEVRHDPTKVVPSKLSSPDVPPAMIGELLQGKDSFRREDGKYDRRSVPIDEDTIAQRLINDEEGNPVAYAQDFNTADIAAQAGTPEERGGSKESFEGFVPDYDGSNRDLSLQSHRMLAMISSLHADGIDIPRSDVDPALLEKYGLSPDGDDIHINVDMPPQSLSNKTVVQVKPKGIPDVTVGDLNGFTRNAKSLQSQMALIEARYTPDAAFVDELVDLQDKGSEKEQVTAEAALKGLRSFVYREEKAKGLKLPENKGEKDALADSYVPQYHQYLAERVGSSELAQRNRRNQNTLYNALRDGLTTPERVHDVIDVLSSPFIQPEGRVLTDEEQRIQEEQEMAEDKALLWARGLDLEYVKTDTRDLVDTLVEFQANGLQSYEMYQEQFNKEVGSDPTERTTIDEEFITYAQTGGRTPMAGIDKQKDAWVRRNATMTVAHQRQVAETLPTKLKALVDEQAPFLYDPAAQQLEFELSVPLRYDGREFLDVAHIGASYKTYTSAPVLDENGEPTGFEVKDANVAEGRLGPFSQKAYDNYVEKSAEELADIRALQEERAQRVGPTRVDMERANQKAEAELKAKLQARPTTDPKTKSKPAPPYWVQPREADLVVRPGWSRKLQNELNAVTELGQLEAIEERYSEGQDAASIAGISLTVSERRFALQEEADAPRAEFERAFTEEFGTKEEDRKRRFSTVTPEDEYFNGAPTEQSPDDPPSQPPPPDTEAQAKFRKIVERMLGFRVNVIFGEDLPEGMAAEYVPGRDLDAINEARRQKLYEAESIERILKDPSSKIPIDELGDPAALRAEAKELAEEAKNFRADLAVRGTIRVAEGREAQAGLAEHEAFHAAFDIFFGQGNKEDRKVITTAFTRGVLSRRLIKYFEGNEAVLAVIDPTSKDFIAEEAAAYAFQVYLHEPGALQMGQKVEGIFNRFLAYLQRLVGYRTYEERAQTTFADLASGKRAERGVSVLRNSASMEESMLDRSRGFAREVGKGIMHMYDTVLSSSYSRLEGSGNVAMAQIARLGYNETGQRGQGMIQLQRLATTKYSNQMKDALHMLDQEELDQLNQFMLLGEDAPGKLAEPQRRLRAIFKEMHAYQVEAGIDDIGDLENYFPMIWNPEKVAEDAQGFVEMLNDKYGDEMALSKQTAEEVRDNILAFDERGHEFQGIFGEDGEPVADSSKRRSLAFIKNEDRLKYMESDLVTTLAHYMNQSVRHAEYVRAYGRNGSRLKELMGEITSTYGGSKTDVDLAKDYIDGLMGNKEVGMSRELKDLYGAMTVYQNVRLLPLSVFSSLVDPLGIAVRTQSMGAAFDAFGYSIRNMFTDFRNHKDVNWTPEMWEQYAADMGTIDMSGTVKSIDKIYTGVTLRGKTREINDGFFKWNLLNGWVKNNHIMATKAAQLYLRRNAEGEMFTGEMRDQNLAEAGVSAEDIVYDEALGRIRSTAPEILGYDNVEQMNEEATADDIADAQAQATRIQQAIHKIVRQSMIQPSSAEMPGWMSNPYLAPIAHLKTFVFGFNATILERLLYEAQRGNYSPIYYAAAYVPGMIAFDFIKGFAGNGGEEPEWKKNWGVSDYLGYGVERSGLMGTGQFIHDMNNDVTRGGGGWETLAGPSIEQATDLMRAMNAKTSQPTQTWMMNAMPVNALYDQWLMR